MGLVRRLAGELYERVYCCGLKTGISDFRWTCGCVWMEGDCVGRYEAWGTGDGADTPNGIALTTDQQLYWTR